VKFGVFVELSVPRPWTPGAEREVYENSIRYLKLADELGFDYAWCVEHHFLEEYSHSSAPDLFLCAVARETKRIRIGHGIVICVPQINPPVRIAERAAVLDILSGGRLDVGTGRSSTWTELAGFGVDPADTKKYWDETVRALPKMWTQEYYSHDGTAFSMPERAVLPKPIQDPHPPLWVAVTSPGTELDAADRGLGSLGLTFGGFGEQEERIATYRKRIQQCDPVGAVNEQVHTVNFMHCSEDDERGTRVGQRLAATFSYISSQLLSAREATPTPAYPSLGLLPQLRRESGAPGDEKGVPEGLTIGDPDRITRVLRRWESCGVDGVNFLMNTMERVPHEDIESSLRLFAREVMPKFRTGEPAPTGAEV